MSDIFSLMKHIEQDQLYYFSVVKFLLFKYFILESHLKSSYVKSHKLRKTLYVPGNTESIDKFIDIYTVNFSGDSQEIIKKNMWKPDCFTNPKNHNNFTFKYIIHCTENINILNEIDEDILAQWDLVSASLVSNTHSCPYGMFGIIMSVPAENIAITSPDDLMFENNAGNLSRVDYVVNNFKNREYERLSRMSHIQRSSLLSKEINNHQRRKNFLTPDELLKQSSFGNNELIIITKPGVSLTTYKNTNCIKVSGLFVANFNTVDYYLREKYSQIVRKISKISNARSLPFVRLPVNESGQEKLLNSLRDHDADSC